MKKLTEAAIKRPVTVIVSLVALILFSLVAVNSMQLKLMPDISVPMLVVMATYPGASPEEVDENVLEKIMDATSNVTGLRQSRTQAYESYGYLMLRFDYGTDISEAHDSLRTKIDAIIDDLPDSAGTPTILELDMDSVDDMTISVSTDAQNIDLLNLVNDKLEPQLRRASALADISISGGDERYIAIRLIPEYAGQYGITQNSVVGAITGMNYSMPAGSVSYGEQVLNMESEVRFNDIEKLKQIPITTSKGETIHLYDVCDISYGVSDKTQLSRYDGNDNISIGLKRKQSSSSVSLSRQINSILDDFKASNPDITVEVINDSADEIVSTLKSVFKTLMEGVLLAMAVIFIFFGDIKGSLIVGSTMPISLIAALVCMYFAGITMNVVSMVGLVLSIGMITDNAVVVIELCFRKQEDGFGFKEAALEGTKVVMGSIVGSTITTVVVYLPLAMLEGLSGQLFRDLGFTIVFVLIASLLCATTLVPFFFSIYRPVERLNNPVTKLIDKVAKVYVRLLKRIMKHNVIVVLTAIAIFAVSILLATTLRTELLSATDEGIIDISVTFRPNLSLEAMDQTVKELEEFVEESGLAKKHSITISESSSSASVTAYKADEVERTTQEIVDEWNEALGDFSALCEITVSSGSTTGMSQMNMGGSEEIDIAADDLNSLRKASEAVTQILESTDGILSVTSSVEGAGAKVKIDIDPQMARAKGLNAAQLSQMIYANMNGADAGELTIDHVKYDIKVEYPKDFFLSLDDVRAMTFTNSSGVEVPLSEVADISFTQAAQTVSRTNGRFSASITALMTAETKDVIMDGVHERLDALVLPEGANFIENSITETMNDEFSDIGQAIMIAFYLVFMVMAIQFESIAYSLLIMLCIPFAGIGSILLLLLLNVKVSMTVLLGIMMLAGLVVNNGIIYIDTANQFREEGEEVKEALAHAGRDRLRPILITTLTTELSMLPVALKLAKNTETMQGMAVVIVGGLIASTLLTLLLLPNFYLIFERKDKKDKKRKKKMKNKEADEIYIENIDNMNNESEEKEEDKDIEEKAEKAEEAEKVSEPDGSGSKKE
ncbi:MAG: efflux RND transporter permease subunit [Lachnospiraceae bacterium]|nr:efflux RND transporter permease subunit [Lachnospiraceae bacterium]